jgi:hypothetical protein
MNSLSLVWSPLTSTHSILYYGHITFDLHPLLQECSWDIKQGLGIVKCITEDLVVTGLVCVFTEVFLSALYFRVTCCPTFRACTPLTQVPYVPECPWEGLGNIRHLREWGTSSCSGAIICCMECITASFLTFFQIGENTQWITDGFALGRMCARCANIDHFCTKAPWV